MENHVMNQIFFEMFKCLKMPCFQGFPGIVESFFAKK